MSPLLSIAEASDYLRIGTSTIYQLLGTRLQAVKLNKRRFVTRESADAFVAAGTEPLTAPAPRRARLRRGGMSAASEVMAIHRRARLEAQQRDLLRGLSAHTKRAVISAICFELEGGRLTPFHRAALRKAQEQKVKRAAKARPAPPSRGLTGSDDSRGASCAPAEN